MAKKIKVLVVHDSSSAAFIFQKYLLSDINAIYFSKDDVISKVKNPLFFIKCGISSQINQIKELSKEYDVFLCFGWPAAGLCYLAGVKYIIYFVDAYIDPDTRIRKKISFVKRLFLSSLYSDALKFASETVAALPHDAQILKKYRPNSKIIFQLIDVEMFNENVERIKLNETKFTFFSPQRIEPDKGQLILWEAIRKTKSDFVVLQTDWGSGEYYEKALQLKPDKVKIIPKVPRNKMAQYLRSVDALLGQISKTSCGSTEREAALCMTPVFCYAPYSFSNNDPFYRESTEPDKLAKVIDNIVMDENYRKELVKIQNEWVKETFDNKKSIQRWQNIFESVNEKNPRYHPKIKYRFLIKIFTIIEKITRKDFTAYGRKLE